ncbi:unnamed protein product [Eruca vesicaria subsp. sativa]|uniref:Aldose 1-epimerase n=1 Tax=Eruca vesicaria subsp. sativa TaxID=29727 RepID=A0ABC8L4G9_ERUVS|nr:unnamed protein product [Eruca vesicaria subsp. sativa]
MRLDMEAVPENKDTPNSLAQHTYWNLSGHESGNILNHMIQIWGELLPVKGTPFNFTEEKRIGESIGEVGIGYDHNYVLDCPDQEKDGLKHVARLRDGDGSRVLDLWTDAPGVQFYTGNYVNGVVGKGNVVYEKHAGVCLETHGFPNAVNQKSIPCVVVKAGENYKQYVV